MRPARSIPVQYGPPASQACMSVPLGTVCDGPLVVQVVGPPLAIGVLLMTPKPTSTCPLASAPDVVDSTVNVLPVMCPTPDHRVGASINVEMASTKAARRPPSDCHRLSTSGYCCSTEVPGS